MMEKVSGFIIVWKLRFHTIINAPRGSHCSGMEECRLRDPPQAENPASQDSFLSYRKLCFHTIINALRGCALGAWVVGCRGNRASARKCAKAHSFLLYRKEEIDLKVHAPSYCVPKPCTGENRNQRDYDNAADGADDRRPGQPQRK